MKHPSLPVAAHWRTVFACATALAASVGGAGANPEYSVSIEIRPPDRPAAISPYIYGQYLEHVQREDECIYPSVWDDRSPSADEAGLRKDVIDAVRELGAPVVRWPGGCFADVYHWRDGVGPRDRRPIRPNRHWGGEEPNRFGTDEFLRWCRSTGAEPYVNANLGTGTLEECLDWLEYCRQAGVRGPFWGIGNETFAEWEAGRMDAPTYAATLARWAAAVRRADPDVRILGVGSMSADDPAWDRTVLREAGPLIDFLTIHAYGYATGSADEFPAVAFTPVWFEQRLRTMLSVIDEFAPKQTGAGPVRLALDEWNIRHYRDGTLDRKDPRTLQDAVFAAGVLNALIRLSPRVGMANYVFLVNGNGVLLVNGAQVVRTPLFPGFRQYRECMQGEAWTAVVNGPTVTPPPPQAHSPKHPSPASFAPSPQPWLDAAAALRPDGALAVAMVNRHPAEAGRVELRLPSDFVPKSAWILSDEDVLAENTFARPDRLQPRREAVTSRTQV